MSTHRSAAKTTSTPGGGHFFTAAAADTYDQVMAQFRGLKPELLTEMIRANRGAEKFNRRCESEPGYFEALCGLDDVEHDAAFVD
jgi:hypothetical protein